MFPAATYTITSGGSTVINLGTGFTAGAMTLNGKATLNGTRLRLTDGGTNEASSAWFSSAVNIQQFTTNFSFQITGGTSPTADGFAFVIQGGPSSELGTLGRGSRVRVKRNRNNGWNPEQRCGEI